MLQIAKGKFKSADISAVITRADGTVVDLGKIAGTSWWFRLGPGRVVSWWRIRRANRSVR